MRIFTLSSGARIKKKKDFEPSVLIYGEKKEKKETVSLRAKVLKIVYRKKLHKIYIILLSYKNKDLNYF